MWNLVSNEIRALVSSSSLKAPLSSLLCSHFRSETETISGSTSNGGGGFAGAPHRPLHLLRNLHYRFHPCLGQSEHPCSSSPLTSGPGDGATSLPLHSRFLLLFFSDDVQFASSPSGIRVASAPQRQDEPLRRSPPQRVRFSVVVLFSSFLRLNWNRCRFFGLGTIRRGCGSERRRRCSLWLLILAAPSPMCLALLVNSAVDTR